MVGGTRLWRQDYKGQLAREVSKNIKCLFLRRDKPSPSHRFSLNFSSVSHLSLSPFHGLDGGDKGEKQDDAKFQPEGADV